MIGKFISFSIAVYVVAMIIPGITLKKPSAGVIVALVYGVVHFFLFGLLKFFTFPFIFLTFGLFVFLINAFLLWITDKIVEDFEIKDVQTTVIASLAISLITSIIEKIF